MTKEIKKFKKVVEWNNLIEIIPLIAYGFIIHFIWKVVPILSNKILLALLVLITHIGFRCKFETGLPKREVTYEEI